MSVYKIKYFEEKIKAMTDTEKEQIMTKEEYIASVHN